MTSDAIRRRRCSSAGPRLIDRKCVLCCLQNMRMLCNSTLLFDKQTKHSPKLAEFREIVRELVVEEGRKVVVFSEYKCMTHLAGEQLKKVGIGFVYLHCGVPSRNREGTAGRPAHSPAS